MASPVEGDAQRGVEAEGESCQRSGRRMEASVSRAAYEIHAVGEVPRDMLEDFAGVSVSIDPAGTTIHALLADESELHGLLDVLSRGGFQLVDVRREAFDAWEDGSSLADSPPADL